jgi:hypothetical protein
MFPEMLTGVPTGTSAVLDMTAEFAPLLIGLYGLLIMCVGGLILSGLSPRTDRIAQPMDKRAVCTAPGTDMSDVA